MKDNEKDASEVVIEGEAVIRPGRKKVSSKSPSRKKTSANEKQLESELSENVDNDSNADNQSKNKQYGSSQIRKLFSLRNISVLIVFISAIAGGWIWTSNKNLIPAPQESLKLSSIFDEATERLLETEKQLNEFKMQIKILESEIEMLKEQIGQQTQDDTLGSVSSQLSQLRNMFDELDSNMAPPQIQTVAVEELSSLKAKRIIHLIEVLWLDSQIGRDLTTYPSVIQKLKKIYADENELFDYLGLVDSALSGNLSSHAIMLFNLNRDLSEDMGNAETSKSVSSLNKKTDSEKEQDEFIAQESDSFSWAQYFAGLVKFQKISEENDSSKISKNKEREIVTAKEGVAKLSTSLKPKSIETMSEAISYLTLVLDNGNSGLNSEQINKLNFYLVQIKSRLQVDKMIDDIYQSQGMLFSREEK